MGHQPERQPERQPGCISRRYSPRSRAPIRSPWRSYSMRGRSPRRWDSWRSRRTPARPAPPPSLSPRPRRWSYPRRTSGPSTCGVSVRACPLGGRCLASAPANGFPSHRNVSRTSRMTQYTDSLYVSCGRRRVKKRVCIERSVPGLPDREMPSANLK